MKFFFFAPLPTPPSLVHRGLKLPSPLQFSSLVTLNRRWVLPNNALRCLPDVLSCRLLLIRGLVCPRSSPVCRMGSGSMSCLLISASSVDRSVVPVLLTPFRLTSGMIVPMVVGQDVKGTPAIATMTLSVSKVSMR